MLLRGTKGAPPEHVQQHSDWVLEGRLMADLQSRYLVAQSTCSAEVCPILHLLWEPLELAHWTSQFLDLCSLYLS